MKNFFLLALIGSGCLLSACKKIEEDCYVFTITVFADVEPDVFSEYSN